nr:hypothetical protein [Vibrio vulnificus]
SLRNYNAQVGETYAMIKALNKLQGLVFLKIRILYISYSTLGNLVSRLNYAAKPCITIGTFKQN